ncbi:MAG: mannose-6-phosphate isomerase, class I [Homoserinimonas sp.]
MFVGIENTPRGYDWGSDNAISELLGAAPAGGPEAELWLGSHAGSPARVTDPAEVGGARDLAEWIAASPSDALGSHPRLPFLFKVLAAGAPLSLQAHPTTQQAQDGFARENALGVRLDAPQRNYKDPYPKPEIILAVSERFEALCGFRPVGQTIQLARGLGLDDLAARLENQPLADVFEWLITRGDGVAALIDRVVALAAGEPKTKEIDAATAAPDAETTESGRDSFVLGNAIEATLDTVRRLDAAHPGDPGIVVSLLINRVTLRRGDALYLPAGNIHAYLDGLAVELMVASDNVLRGGLTSKHVDVAELLRVLDFSTTEVPYLRPLPVGGAQLFQPDGPGIALLQITGPASHALTGPAIALCTAGRLTVTGVASSAELSRGDAVYVTPDEAALTFAGEGEVFLATTA